MTDAQMGAIISAVKRSRWNAEIGMRLYLKRNPDVVPEAEMYGVAIGVGRTPFPNIQGIKEGPFPLDQAKPWKDTRYRKSPAQVEWDREMAALS